MKAAVARLIAVTGYGGQEAHERSREAGFDDHFVKPFDPASLDRLLADDVKTSSAAKSS